MKDIIAFGIFITVVIFAGGAAWWLYHDASAESVVPIDKPAIREPMPDDNDIKIPHDTKLIMSFEECVAAGYPVMESYPRRCATVDGKHFVEDVVLPPIEEYPSEDIRKRDGCIITGCSGQLCAGEELASTCEFLEEYVCYRDAICARQTSGECGWVQTMELVECILDARESAL